MTAPRVAIPMGSDSDLPARVQNLQSERLLAADALIPSGKACQERLPR